MCRLRERANATSLRLRFHRYLPGLQSLSGLRLISLKITHKKYCILLPCRASAFMLHRAAGTGGAGGGAEMRRVHRQRPSGFGETIPCR